MSSATLRWRHLVNACEVKAHLIGLLAKTWRCLFLADGPPLWANLIVAAVLRDSVCAVSLLPCVAECYIYCILYVRLSGVLTILKEDYYYLPSGG